MGKEKNLEVKLLDVAQAWKKLPQGSLKKTKWDIQSVKQMVWHVPYGIQMEHPKCEINGMACPLYHRGCQFLASSIVGKWNSEVGGTYWCVVTFKVTLQQEKNVHSASKFWVV
jgi:hypothetical protein